MTKKRLFIGVDFDGTIVEEGFPNIGAIKPRTVEFMQRCTDEGHLVIVWTARSGVYEKQAIDFLNKHGIPYHYVNENPEDEYAIRGEQGRKLFCNYYLDDRAIHVDDIEDLFKEVFEDNRSNKAMMKNELCIDYSCGTRIKLFDGDVVDIIREVRKEMGKRQYMVYHYDTNASTVVSEDEIRFI